MPGYSPTGEKVADEALRVWFEGLKVLRKSTELAEITKGSRYGLEWLGACVQHAQAIIALVRHHHPASAWALLRTMVECYGKGIWALTADDKDLRSERVIDKESRAFMESIWKNQEQKWGRQANAAEKAAVDLLKKAVHKKNPDGSRGIIDLNGAVHANANAPAAKLPWRRRVREREAIFPAVKAATFGLGAMLRVAAEIGKGEKGKMDACRRLETISEEWEGWWRGVYGIDYEAESRELTKDMEEAVERHSRSQGPPLTQ